MNPAPPVTSAFTSPRRGAPPARSASCAGETGAEPGECPPQPFVDVDPWLPAEQRPRPRDVGLPDLGVVLGKRLEHDLARRGAQPQDLLRQLEERHLLRVADVHRLGDRGLPEPPDPLHYARDVLERPRLRTVYAHRGLPAGRRRGD